MGVRREITGNSSREVTRECADAIGFIAMQFPWDSEFSKGGLEGNGEKCVEWEWRQIEELPIHWSLH
jgi:hypothetical protein